MHRYQNHLPNAHRQTTPHLVVDLISSKRECVLLSFQRNTLHPPSYGTSWILLFTHHSATGWCSTATLPSSTKSSPWPATPFSSSGCIFRLDRSTDWTTASRIWNPLRCTPGPSRLPVVSSHVHTIRGFWCLCTAAPTDPPFRPSRYVCTPPTCTSTAWLCASVCYSGTPARRAARLSSDGLYPSMGPCFHGIRPTGPPTARCTTSPTRTGHAR